MDDHLQLLSLRPAAGHLDCLTLERGRLAAQGWMFEPGHLFERIDAYLDGRPAGNVPEVSRPDVEQAFAWNDGAKPSAFELDLDLHGTLPARLDLVGHIAGGLSARLSCFLPAKIDGSMPQPPDPLAERVSGLHGPVFRTQGLKMYTDLMDQMTRLGISVPRRMLDWGCGCGRVASYFIARLPQVRFAGCDIDGEAIQWCSRHLAGDFVRVAPAPPTPFEDGSMDLIVACSVLTHLGVEEQERWLREMKRILAPGGWFLASTSGEFMFQLARRKRPRSWLHSAWKRLRGKGRFPQHLSGILDAEHDRALDGIAPTGYYRRTFQSRAHTIKACSRHFQVVDYLERGLNGHQDLVILRR
jgi:SAM-dependent methyltransferase